MQLLGLQNISDVTNCNQYFANFHFNKIVVLK